MSVLPFLTEGQVQKQGGEATGTLKLSVWRAGSPRETRVGEAYDWTGEAHVDAAPLLVGKANRQIVVGAQRFKVISAVKHDFLPHVALNLLEMKGA